MTTQEITFEIVPSTAGIAPEQKLSLERSFLPSFQELERLKTEAANATTPQEARAVRLQLVKVRTGADNVRKELKEASLREGRAIDGANAILLNALVPIEKAMESIEKEAERKEQARIAALVAERTERLQSVGGMVPSNLSILSDDQFEAVMKDAAELHRIKQEREAQEEADRLAEIEADRLERKRIEDENAKLKAEAEETARLAKIEADRIAKERAEEQRLAKIEMDKANDAAAQARKEAQAAAAKAKAIQDEADRKAKEIADKEAADRKAEAAAKAKATKAPDADKLNALLAAIKALPIPAMATEDGNAAMVRVKAILNRAYSEIKQIAATL